MKTVEPIKKKGKKNNIQLVIQEEAQKASLNDSLMINQDFTMLSNDFAVSEAKGSHKRSGGLALRREGEPGLCTILQNGYDSDISDSKITNDTNPIRASEIESLTLFSKNSLETTTNRIISIQTDDKSTILDIKNDVETDSNISIRSGVKKRGRKPKGGKLIYKQPENTNIQSSMANVILHLKCSMNDLNEYNNKINKLVSNPLEYNPILPPDILTYNGESQTFSEYSNNEIVHEKIQENIQNPIQIIDKAYNEMNKNNYICSLCKSNNDKSEFINNEELEENNTDDSDINIKDINYKLKKLKINLYKNNCPEKKSACFWCTYEYDNPTCYIPKYDMDDKVYGYGSFCRPECAVAFLMKENIDDSTKFERYHLLNQIYSKVYDFKKNIKPAPNPYYLLDKFYGNLTIQEYRKLLKTEHMMLIIEKPMTRILPELHEDNDDMMMNIYGTGNRILNGIGANTSGVYKVKRQSEKQVGPSKTSIIRDTFGMT